MKIIKLEESVESTEDCKSQLNSLVANKKWKRLYKLGDLRCFTNEDNEFVTIARSIFEEEEEYCAFIGIDVQDEIKAIRNIAKFYHTCDYGDIYYNPYTKNIHIVTGDGGYCFSKTPIKDEDIDEAFEPYGEGINFKDFNTHAETTFIKNVEWADEHEPDEDGYMLVGKINEI